MSGGGPPNGHMVWWRFKTQAPGPWRFGYVSATPNPSLVRMGNWNGSMTSGVVVDPNEIEWRPYQ